MNKSETITNLAKALASAQGELPVIKFNSTNPFLKNHYADLGAVISGVRAVLAKHGLAVTQLTSGEDNVIGVETVLMHASGEWISDKVSLPIGEERGKSSAQVAGSIITYLRRYALASILGVYADEDGDGNKAAPQAQAEPEPEPETVPFTLEDAMKIQNSEGQDYGSIGSDKLSAMTIGIGKALKNGVSDEERETYQRKLAAIKLILSARKNGEI